MRSPAHPNSSTSVRDSLVVFWVVLWLTVGVLTGYQVWSLSSASQSATASARAADQAGRALQEISELPLVPEGPGALGQEVRSAAEEIETSAERFRGDVRQLGILLGLSIAVVPTVPVAVFALVSRWVRRRAVRVVRNALLVEGQTPQFEAYLAHQALQHLDYAQLTQLTEDPVGDLLAGRHRVLADAELARLGIEVDGVSRTA